MVEAVIFDMDGLMVDTEPLQAQSFEIVLREYGVEPVMNHLGIVQKIGLSALDNWIFLREQYDLQVDPSELVRRKRAVYSKLLANQIDPMPGLLSLVARLDSEHVKRAVASSSSETHINMIVGGLGLSAFHAIVSGEYLERGKPHPDIFLQVAALLDVTPSRCVVLEDAESGVIGAHAAGMKVIAVPNRFTRDHDFSKATVIVPSLEAVTRELLLVL